MAPIILSFITLLPIVTAKSQTGIIITGGYGEEPELSRTSAEILLSVEGDLFQCELPDLPDARYSHTQDKLTACGGYTREDCITLDPSSGLWRVTSELLTPRYCHVSWDRGQNGLTLMGGSYSGNTSEYVSSAGSNGQSFPLRYNTRWACTIADSASESVILTGGVETLETVSRYGVSGWLENMPSLTQGRESHGCGAYSDQAGNMVMLVTGGWDGVSKGLDSTEILHTDEAGWRLIAGSLPLVLWGLRVASLDQELLIFGGKNSDGSYNHIMEFDISSGTWSEKGHMFHDRYWHSLSSLPLDEDILRHCK